MESVLIVSWLLGLVQRLNVGEVRRGVASLLVVGRFSLRTP
jgi:hypothetical protein